MKSGGTQMSWAFMPPQGSDGPPALQSSSVVISEFLSLDKCRRTCLKVALSWRDALAPLLQDL